MDEQTPPSEITGKQDSILAVPPAENKPSNSPVMVTITVIVIAALGITGFFIIKHNKTTIDERQVVAIPSPTLAQTEPTIDPIDENAIESINAGDADQSDFEVVEADLKTL